MARRQRSILLLLGLAGCGEGASLEQLGQQIQVCAGPNVLEGIDVSQYQGTIDWNAVRASGRAFAIARIGDGLFEDATFDRNYAGIRSVGMVRGSYQYFRPGRDPVAQADIVIRRVGRLGNGDLPVVCDVESDDGQSAATVQANLRIWLDRVEAGTGRRPIVYTAQYFWNTSVGGTAAFATYPLWVANYGPRCPNIPMGWSNWTMWQYSSTGSVPGISGNVDLDQFNGTQADLDRLAGGVTYGARYVSQSWPLASEGALQIYAGETVHAFIELRNSGSADWNSNTRLATTEPRDRASVFAAPGWLQPDRPAGVMGTIATGGTYRFEFDFRAPLTPGRYSEHFSVVQEGVTWFGDPGQGGPADNVIEAAIEVLPPRADGGVGDATVSDGAVRDASARDGSADGGMDPAMGGCGCRVAGSSRRRDTRLGILAVALGLGITHRRRRSVNRQGPVSARR